MNIADFLLYQNPPESRHWRQVFIFPNNYGASIIRNMASYGNERGLFELAVLYVKTHPRPEKLGFKDLAVAYDTPITDDVIGGLELIHAMAMLTQIAQLPPYHGGIPSRQAFVKPGDSNYVTSNYVDMSHRNKHLATPSAFSANRVNENTHIAGAREDHLNNQHLPTLVNIGTADMAKRMEVRMEKRMEAHVKNLMKVLHEKDHLPETKEERIETKRAMHIESDHLPKDD